MIRLLVGVMLLHHLEGVCKPLSGVKAAITALVQAFGQEAATRDRTAAVVAASDRQAAAIERAQLAASQRQHRGSAVTASWPARAALGAVPPVVMVVDQLRQAAD